MTADQIITYYKGVQPAADAIGVTRQAFDHWKKRGVPTPVQRFVELDTKGKLKAAKK